MLIPGKTNEEVYHSFQWQIPEYYNIGVDICDKWADRGNRPALIYEEDNGRVDRYTFRDLKDLSNRLANGLQAANIGIGDRLRSKTA
jgi:acetyl-CoA synthetase